MKESYYFAYGSNMNLDQMAYRCPAASVVEKVKLEGYRLTFCGRGKGCGVATILPEEGSRVEGVLWKITPECEKSLDFYEGTSSARDRPWRMAPAWPETPPPVFIIIEV